MKALRTASRGHGIPAGVRGSRPAPHEQVGLYRNPLRMVERPIYIKHPDSGPVFAARRGRSADHRQPTFDAPDRVSSLRAKRLT